MVTCGTRFSGHIREVAALWRAEMCYTMQFGTKSTGCYTKEGGVPTCDHYGKAPLYKK